MDRVRVHISDKNRWHERDGVHVCGGAFSDGSWHGSEELSAAFESTSGENLASVVSDLNGFYSIVREREDAVFAAVDRIRSTPLFYGREGGEVYVSDDAHWVRDRVGDEGYDEQSRIEYLLTSYVTGNDTLSPGVKQLQSGEALFVRDGSDGPSVSTKRWYRYTHEQAGGNRTQKELLSDLDTVLVGAYRRLIDRADGRPIVVNLSGGHDSRLNLLMLERLGYDNVIALTYAAQRAGEVDACRRIVDDTTIQWVYVPYDHEEWYEWYHSAEYERFEQEVGFLDSIPALPNALAVKKATERGLIPDDSIFVTGDSASTTGEHILSALTQSDELTRDDVLRIISRFHYKFWDWDEGELGPLLRSRVAEALIPDSFDSNEAAISAVEEWDWQERQSKHITLTHVFEFWEYDWWLPLWDAEYMDFWADVPIEHRVDKSLHRRYVERLYQHVTGVSQETMQESFWGGNGTLSKVENAIRGSPIDPIGTRLDPIVRKVYFSVADPKTYGDWPVFGILSEERFEAIQTGRLPIHGVHAVDILDRTSSGDSDGIETTDDGVLSRVPPER